ncbi:MAG: FHIPEP family type III secretion protein, partial [Vulcanimicrobiota bacterium]
LNWEEKEVTQSFIKLTKGNRTALLYGGNEELMDVQVNKELIKLKNRGWKPGGEITLDFDNRPESEKELENLYHRDAMRVEIGMKLLPLVDPGAGAPLSDMVKNIRKDLAGSTGIIIPGIRIQDNMQLPPDSYVIYIKDTPIASNEIYLTRFLVYGSMEQLNELKGWSVKDPVFRSQALWVEPDQRDKAEELGCLIMGPLNVLVTHIREAVERNLRELLGLQDVKHMLDQLMKTHPVVVEDYVNNKKKLRQIRKVLLNLVGERVSIRDMVTIMETIGEIEDKLDKTNWASELVRLALRRQICWSYIGAEGKIIALSLSRNFEKKIQGNIQESKEGARLALSHLEAEEIINNLKKTLEDYDNPRVIFCEPHTRIYFRRLTEATLPDLGILSTAEIAPGVPIEIVGQVTLPGEDKVDSVAGEEKEKKSGGLFGLIKG